MATDIAASGLRGGGAPRKGRAVRLSTGDRVAVTIMVGIPVLVTGGLIWFPTISSILLSFTNWDGIGGLRVFRSLRTSRSVLISSTCTRKPTAARLAIAV